MSLLRTPPAPGRRERPDPPLPCPPQPDFWQKNTRTHASFCPHISALPPVRQSPVPNCGGSAAFQPQRIYRRKQRSRRNVAGFVEHSSLEWAGCFAKGSTEAWLRRYVTNLPQRFDWPGLMELADSARLLPSRESRCETSCPHHANARTPRIPRPSRKKAPMESPVGKPPLPPRPPVPNCGGYATCERARADPPLSSRSDLQEEAEAAEGGYLVCCVFLHLPGPVGLPSGRRRRGSVAT